MNYREAESYLLQREIFGWKLGLERMQLFLAELGQPQEAFASVHIAGTNGKGSVTAMLSSLLQESGLSCGMYTSPHLQSLRERIRVNRAWIDEASVIGLVERWRPLIEELQCTFFETMTGLAFRHFADVGVEAAVIEVGLGGRLDATNLLLPNLTIITTISYDHMEHLGDTLAAIAAEKAGILKPGVPCVIGSLPQEAEEVVRRRASALASPLFMAEDWVEVHPSMLDETGSRFSAVTAEARYDDLWMPLPGPHQIRNAAIAISAGELLGRQGVIPQPPPLNAGFARVEWPGRFELISREPWLIIDVAHNPGGFEQQRWMLEHFFPGWEKALVLGLVKDKDLAAVVAQLPVDAAAIYAVPAPTHRSLPVSRLVQHLAEAHVPAIPCSTVRAGVEAATAWAAEGSRRLVCITGSHYVVGEALNGIKGLTK
jgi:dihydrofolate synthase/folylpolyglutamate synthase